MNAKKVFVLTKEGWIQTKRIKAGTFAFKVPKSNLKFFKRMEKILK